MKEIAFNGFDKTVSSAECCSPPRKTYLDGERFGKRVPFLQSSDLIGNVMGWLDVISLHSSSLTCKSFEGIASTRTELWKSVDYSSQETRVNDELVYPSLRKRIGYVSSLTISSSQIIGKCLSMLPPPAPEDGSYPLVHLDLSKCTRMMADELVLFVHHCVHLESLVLTGSAIVFHDESFEKVIGALTTRSPAGEGRLCQLKSLQLGLPEGKKFTKGLTASVCSIIALSCPKLQTLSLANHPQIGDAGLGALAFLRHPSQPSLCTNLKEVDISHCTRVTDVGLELLGNCSKLTTVNLRNCWCVTSAGIAILVQKCRQIEVLNLNGCTRIGRPALEAISVSLSRLEDINLGRNNKIMDSDLGLLPRSVRHVRLSLCDNITTDGVLALCLRLRLVSLNVGDCKGVSASFITSLATMYAEAAAAATAEDTNGNSNNTNNADTTLPSRAPLTSLLMLNLNRCSGLTDEVLECLLAPAGPEGKGCGAVHLQRVYLGRGLHGDEEEEQAPGVTDKSLILLAKVLGKHLEALSVERWPLVSDDGIITMLKACSNLRKLHLAGLPLLTDAVVDTLQDCSSCHRLQDLRLTHCQGLRKLFKKRGQAKVVSNISTHRFV